MKIYTPTRLADQTRWGVFSNIWPTALCRADRAADGVRHFHIHTPWRLLMIYWA